MNLARKVRDEVDAALQDFDLLITPTMVRLPQRIDTYDPKSTPLQKMAFASGVGLNTCPYSLVSLIGLGPADDPQTGHPALSLPVGFLAPLDDETVQLPVGMQIIGKFYDEGTIYAAAHAWEQAFDWKARA